MKKEGDGEVANIRSPFCVSRRVCDEDEKGLWPERERERKGWYKNIAKQYEAEGLGLKEKERT